MPNNAAIAPTVDGSHLRDLRHAAMRVDAAFPTTLHGFADRVGLSASYLARIERGERVRPSFNTVAMIAECGLGIPAEAIWRG